MSKKVVVAYRKQSPEEIFRGEFNPTVIAKAVAKDSRSGNPMIGDGKGNFVMQQNLLSQAVKGLSKEDAIKAKIALVENKETKELEVVVEDYPHFSAHVSYGRKADGTPVIAYVK